MRYGDSWPTGQQSGGPAVTFDPYQYGPPEYEPDDSEAQQAADVFADAAAEGPLFGPPSSMWVCEDCGWQWPLKDAPYQDAECDACGGEMHPVPKARESL
jgi:hypothetical protein